MNRKILIIGILLILIGILVGIYRLKIGQLNKDAAIRIGVSTIPDAVRTYGQPSWKTNIKEDVVVGFESTGSGSFTTINFDKGNKTSLVVTRNPGTTMTDVVSEHGQTSSVLHGYLSRLGFVLYVYPEKGLAFLGNNQTNAVAEKWVFKQMTFDEFQKQHGAGMVTSPPDEGD